MSDKNINSDLPSDNGSKTDDFHLSDDIKTDGMVTKVGGRKLDSQFAKPAMRKGK